MDNINNNEESKLIVKECDYELILKLRESIFGPIGKDREFFTLDTDLESTTKHLGLYKEDDDIEDGTEPITIVSVNFTKLDNGLQFRYLGTKSHYQKKGYASIMINHFINNIAKLSNCKRVWCNARTHKASFYIKNFDFKETTTTYTKNGVDFIVLEKFI